MSAPDAAFRELGLDWRSIVVGFILGAGSVLGFFALVYPLLSSR